MNQIGAFRKAPLNKKRLRLEARKSIYQIGYISLFQKKTSYRQSPAARDRGIRSLSLTYTNIFIKMNMHGPSVAYLRGVTFFALCAGLPLPY